MNLNAPSPSKDHRPATSLAAANHYWATIDEGGDNEVVSWSSEEERDQKNGAATLDQF